MDIIRILDFWEYTVVRLASAESKWWEKNSSLKLVETNMEPVSLLAHVKILCVPGASASRLGTS